MYAWLFAAAAHLESEILVDEVLAVGDAEFQKMLGKNGRCFKGEGQNSFVSHNMEALKTLCNKGFY